MLDADGDRDDGEYGDDDDDDDDDDDGGGGDDDDGCSDTSRLLWTFADSVMTCG